MSHENVNDMSDWAEECELMELEEGTISGRDDSMDSDVEHTLLQDETPNLDDHDHNNGHNIKIGASEGNHVQSPSAAPTLSPSAATKQGPPAALNLSPSAATHQSPSAAPNQIPSAELNQSPSAAPIISPSAALYQSPSAATYQTTPAVTRVSPPAELQTPQTSEDNPRRRGTRERKPHPKVTPEEAEEKEDKRVSKKKTSGLKNTPKAELKTPKEPQPLEEAQNKAEKEAQLREHKEAKKKAQKEAQQKAKLKADQEASLKAQINAQLKATNAQIKTQLKVNLEAKQKATQETQMNNPNEATQEAQLKASQEAQLKAKAQQLAAQDAQMKASQEAQIRAAQEALQKATQEAKLKATQDALRIADLEKSVDNLEKTSRLKSQQLNDIMSAQEINNKETAKKNKILTEQNQTLEESLQNILTQMETMRGQLQDAQADNVDLSKTNGDLSKKLQETEDMNEYLLKTIVEKDPPKPTQPTQAKPKVLIIGDSNIQNAKDQLDRQKAAWTITNNIFTTTHLIRALENEQITNQIKQQDIVIIHLGTNDLRNDETEANTYSNIQAAATTIANTTGVPVHVDEIPPMLVPDRPDLGPKAAILNSRIKATVIQGVSVAATSKQYKEHTYGDLLDKKGFHLNSTGLEALITTLELTATKTTTTPTTQTNPTKPQEGDGEDQITTIIIDAKSEQVGHVVGKKRAKIQQLEKEFNARIRVVNSTNGSTIQVKAMRSDALKAKDTITKLLDIKQDDSTKPQPQQTCEFYAQGRCRYGASCNYRHPHDGNKRDRSPSPRPRTHNPKLTPKSPPRKRGKPVHRRNRSTGRNDFTVLE